MKSDNYLVDYLRIIERPPITGLLACFSGCLMMNNETVKSRRCKNNGYKQREINNT